MKKIYLSLLSFAATGIFTQAMLEDTKKVRMPVTQAQSTSSNFSPGRIGEIEKLVGDYITKHPEIVMAAIQPVSTFEQTERKSKRSNRRLQQIKTKSLIILVHLSLAIQKELNIW